MFSISQLKFDFHLLVNRFLFFNSRILISTQIKWSGLGLKLLNPILIPNIDLLIQLFMTRPPPPPPPSKKKGNHEWDILCTK